MENEMRIHSATTALQTLALVATLCASLCQGQSPSSWEVGPTGTQVSLRGLAAFDDQIIWASGSEGTIIRSTDGGSSWTNCSPPGFGEVEFRSIEALSEKTACVASAGTPAVLLLTDDAGKTWHETYRNESPKAFFDSLKFWDAHRGIAMSDPVDGRLLVVETRDGGESWNQLSESQLPIAADGEAAFAASNGSIAVASGGRTWIGTGGVDASSSRLYYRGGWDQDFKVYTCPLASGTTRGIFALAWQPAPEGTHSTLISVGGDYRENTKADIGKFADDTQSTAAAWSRDAGQTWKSAQRPPPAFRSSVIYVPESISSTVRFLTAGPTGTDFSVDGRVWNEISDRGFHSLTIGKHRVFACGSSGRFAQLKWK